MCGSKNRGEVEKRNYRLIGSGSLCPPSSLHSSEYDNIAKMLLISKDGELTSTHNLLRVMEEKYKLELIITNGKYLKLKGHLFLRGLIEEYESQPFYK